MKIGTTMFTVKFKDKIPCENEQILSSDLAYYLYYLDVIPDELAEWKIEDIKEKKNKDEKEFTEISKNYSTLFQEYALIRLKANELYERNRVIALTLGILRQKLMLYKEKELEIPLDLEKAIETVEYFIYRYITKKQDDRLVEQIVFEE
ncbi:MAG: hypothetical protein KAJ30_08015 [Candidatus Heimdallarchaeota archaeon]|nr:hypothetical protein [Candidatus Heimdallarchaeota archaeon]